MTTVNKFLLGIILLFSTILLGQEKVQFEHEIKAEVLNNNTGIVLVKTTHAVYGIDPETHEIIWENQTLESADFKKYSEIPFTPFIIFESSALISSDTASKSLNVGGVSRKIVNVTNGSVLFDSKKQGYKAVYSTIILPEKNGILVDGRKEKKFVVGLFSLENKKPIWETEINSSFFRNVRGALFNEERLFLDRYKNIFWLKGRSLVKINSETGEIAYKNKGIYTISINTKKDTVFVFSDKVKLKKLNEETAIYALNSKTMDTLWEQPSKVIGNVVDAAVDGNKIVVTTSKGFNIINIKNGEKKWKKSESLPLIKRIVPITEGYLVIQENHLTNIDTLGKRVWEKPVKITYSRKENPVHILENKSEALYITPSKANKVTIESGAKIWKKDVSLNSANYITRNLKIERLFQKVWYDKNRDQFPVFSDNKFYIFSNRLTRAPKSLYKFKFGSKLPSLTFRDKGYLINRLNKFYFFDASGKLKYKKEYGYVNRNTFTQKALRSSSIFVKRGFEITKSAYKFIPDRANQTFRNILVTNGRGGVGNVVSSIYGTYNSIQGSIDNLTDLNSLGLGDYLENVFKRLRKSRETENSIIIVVPKKETLQIIRFDIDTGKEELIKVVSKEQSNFIIDQVEELVYFFIGNEIVIEKV